MTIQYPVRVSLTDETLIVDQDNMVVATTFHNDDDYIENYASRAENAEFIVKCLNERAALTARIKGLEEALQAVREFVWNGGDTVKAPALIDSALAKKDSAHA